MLEIQRPRGAYAPASPGVVPVGGIIMWSGTVATIPANWALCDGTNSTPDLRDKFIVGAKQDDGGVAKTNLTGSLLQSGGSVSHHHADHTVTQPDAHAALSHSAHAGTAVADHASHTHTYSQVVNHVHTQSAGTGTTGNFTQVTTAVDTSSGGTGGSPTQTALSTTTGNPVGGVASGTTDGPNATLTHSVTQPSAHSDHASQTHTGTAVDAHDTLSAPQPFYALAFIMRTA